MAPLGNNDGTDWADAFLNEDELKARDAHRQLFFDAFSVNDEEKLKKAKIIKEHKEFMAEMTRKNRPQ